MAVGVGILYNSGDFAILFFCITGNRCMSYVTPSKSQTILVTCGYFLTHLLWDTTLHIHITDQ